MMQSAPPARIAFVTALAVVLIVLASYFGIPWVLADQTGWLPATLTNIAILLLTFGLLLYAHNYEDNQGLCEPALNRVFHQTF